MTDFLENVTNLSNKIERAFSHPTRQEQAAIDAREAEMAAKWAELGYDPLKASQGIFEKVRTPADILEERKFEAGLALFDRILQGRDYQNTAANIVRQAPNQTPYEVAASVNSFLTPEVKKWWSTATGKNITNVEVINFDNPAHIRLIESHFGPNFVKASSSRKLKNMIHNDLMVVNTDNGAFLSDVIGSIEILNAGNMLTKGETEQNRARRIKNQQDLAKQSLIEYVSTNNLSQEEAKEVASTFIENNDYNTLNQVAIISKQNRNYLTERLLYEAAAGLMGINNFTTPEESPEALARKEISERAAKQQELSIEEYNAKTNRILAETGVFTAETDRFTAVNPITDPAKMTSEQVWANALTRYYEGERSPEITSILEGNKFPERLKVFRRAAKVPFGEINHLTKDQIESSMQAGSGFTGLYKLFGSTFGDDYDVNQTGWDGLPYDSLVPAFAAISKGIDQVFLDGGSVNKIESYDPEKFKSTELEYFTAVRADLARYLGGIAHGKDFDPLTIDHLKIDLSYEGAAKLYDTISIIMYDNTGIESYIQDLRILDPRVVSDKASKSSGKEVTAKAGKAQPNQSSGSSIIDAANNNADNTLQGKEPVQTLEPIPTDINQGTGIEGLPVESNNTPGSVGRSGTVSSFNANQAGIIIQGDPTPEERLRVAENNIKAITAEINRGNKHPDLAAELEKNIQLKAKMLKLIERS